MQAGEPRPRGVAGVARIHRRRVRRAGAAARASLPGPLRGERAGGTGISPYAYEAIARAYKTAGKDPEAAAYKKLADEVPIAEADDREHFAKDIATL